MERSDGERKGERFQDLTKELGSRNTEDRHPSKPVIKQTLTKFVKKVLVTGQPLTVVGARRQSNCN